VTDFPGKAGPGIPPLKDSVKKRQCLRCKSGFLSTWSGERICARCKSTKSWRSGTPSSSPLYGGRH
jgi:hypothetical protein